MAVPEVSSSPYLKDVQRKPVQQLGKNEFMQLLVTQMKYQDPLEPMDNNAYIAQMAQLSSLEQMTNMYEAFNTTQGYTLLGKTVTATVEGIDTTTTESITGKVTKVTVDGSDVTLVVNGKNVKLSNVKEVQADDVGTDKSTS